MDKKNFTIGGLLLVAAFALLYFGPKSAPPARTRPTAPATEKASTATAGSATSTTTPAATTTTQAPLAHAPSTAFAAVTPDSAGATVTKLSNGTIEARFTDSGGALLEVAFIQRDRNTSGSSIRTSSAVTRPMSSTRGMPIPFSLSSISRDWTGIRATSSFRKRPPR